MIAPPNPLFDAVQARILLMVMDGWAREGWEVAAVASTVRAGDFAVYDIPPGHELSVQGEAVMSVFRPGSLLTPA